MPQFTVDLLIEALNEIGMPLKGTKVALLGLSYKANVADGRESPARVIKNLLTEAGANLTVYDPFFVDKSSVDSLDKALDSVDAILVATGHDEFKKIDSKVLNKYKVKVVIDGRNIFRIKKDNMIKSGVIYRGIGI
jgi:UDP-N-acetyl-D-glucosamine dehydrogenase